METAGALNRYTCRKCGYSIVTVNRQGGVTPMFLTCKADLPCSGDMVSHMYQGVEGEPTYEWYKPTEEEKETMFPVMRRHVEQGGLALRKIGGEGIWTRRETRG